MIDFDHADIERLWNSIIHYVPERQKLDFAIDFIKSLEDIGVEHDVLENIVIDGTGAASNPILKKKNQLEELGYDTMMVMIYVSPLVSLERNRSRGERGGRSLRPSIIVRTWNQVNKNVDVFRNMFGNNFILVNNDPEGADKTYNEKEIKKYFDQVTAAREYSDEEKAKKVKEKQELESSIKSLLSDLPEFTPQTQIKSKINGFLS